MDIAFSLAGFAFEPVQLQTPWLGLDLERRRARRRLDDYPFIGRGAGPLGFFNTARPYGSAVILCGLIALLSTALSLNTRLVIGY